MDFNELAKIENETERVNGIYEIFNEEARLKHSKAARIEFLTTVHYIEKYLKEDDKILDIVLLSSPLYHLKNDVDKQNVLAKQSASVRTAARYSLPLLLMTLFSLLSLNMT